jgi:hypothetical protein
MEVLVEELSQVSEDEVILAFVTAELHSPRYGASYRAELRRHGATEDVITRAKLTDAREDQLRRELLRAVRGYPDRFLFQGFPADVDWRRVRLAPVELQRLRYARRMEPWVQLAGGTSVLAGGHNLDRAEPRIRDVVMPIVMPIVEAVRGGARFQPLIALDAGDDLLVLLEGYGRATAYAAAPICHSFDVFVGSSSGIRGWAWD